MDDSYEIKSRLLAYSPNLKESWLLLVYILVGFVILSATIVLIKRITGITAEVSRGPLGALLTAIVIVMIVSHLGRHSNYVPISSPRQSPLLCLFFMLFVMSVYGVTAPLWAWMTKLVPMFDIRFDIMSDITKRIVAKNNLSGFVLIVICYPIFEEWLHRGIILKGLLTHYSPFKAIMWSAVLFSVTRLHTPRQVLEVFCFALMVGWVYWQTKSLWHCMLMHMVNNATMFFARAIFIRFFKPPSIDVTMTTDLAGGYYIIIFLVALLMCVLSVIGIKKVIVPYDTVSGEESI
ncbi:MAG: CPBP family intramembrane metalloprotease [Syntrophorhabdaceae bacterium]|nr:CPBP family intramembrane metalloprotease [Syntrophorhabdaceae bacterium]